jgi:hypothetical protein
VSSYSTCWKCDTRPGRDPLGLCDPCNERLRLEQTYIPAPSRLEDRPFRFPEEIDEYKVPRPEDFVTRLIQ